MFGLFGFVCFFVCESACVVGSKSLYCSEKSESIWVFQKRMRPVTKSNALLDTVAYIPVNIAKYEK